MELNVYIRFTSHSFGSCFRILAVITSKTRAFFGLIFWFNFCVF